MSHEATGNDDKNGVEFPVDRAKSQSARLGPSRPGEKYVISELQTRGENISKLRQVLLSTRTKVAIMRRLQKNPSGRGSLYLRREHSDVITRHSADPVMVHRKRTASMRKSRTSTCTSKESSARRKFVRRRFVRLVRLLMTVLRTMKIIIRISDDLTPRTAIEMQWYALNHDRVVRKLAFNPSVYDKCRVYAKLPRWSRDMLNKDPDVRTDTECRRLHALLRGLKSFDKFTEEIQLAMCRSFTYLKVDERRIILRRGHVGQNYYFIYSGSVFVNVEEQNSNGDKFVKTEVVFSKGDSFGELSLLQDIRRTATISCRETCELLGVDKRIFAQVCPKIFDKELAEKVSFVSRLPLFHSKYWSPEVLHNLCFESQIQEYKTNKVVVVDAALEEWIYICMEGQCRIIKCLALEEQSSEADDHEGALLQDDELLTAEFLDSMNSKGTRSGSHRRSAKSSRPGSMIAGKSTVKHRKQLLQSLGLDYISDTNDKLQKDFLSKNSEERRVQEHRERALQGVITLTMLMQNKMAVTPDTVFLSIGTLHPGEVFDLAEILKPSACSSKSCLTLVSSGARVLRIRRDCFCASLTTEALEHAKHIAVKNLYPSNKILIKSYREKTRWDKYKQRVLGDVLGPCQQHARRRDVIARANATSIAHAQSRARDTRLISTLRRQNEPEVHLEAPITDTLALDEPILGDHDDFESRLLREVDERMTDKMRLVAINPKQRRRRSSLVEVLPDVQTFTSTMTRSLSISV